METEAINSTYQTPPPEQYSAPVADPPPETSAEQAPPEEIQDEDIGNNVDLLA